MKLFKRISRLCDDLTIGFRDIPAERQEQLKLLSDYLSKKLAQGITPKITVICTHNSRRSHIGQIWLAVGADYYDLPKIQTFSGGTEATSFNIRAVDSFRRIGIKILADENPDNPKYSVRWASRMKPYQAFSKKFDDAPNPKEMFAAIMVCAEADADCPLVFGCDFRLSLPYEDPKAFDGTDVELEKYDERVRQIGREMLFVLSNVKAVTL